VKDLFGFDLLNSPRVKLHVNKEAFKADVGSTRKPQLIKEKETLTRFPPITLSKNPILKITRK
jgi:hypothetical protein